MSGKRLQIGAFAPAAAFLPALARAWLAGAAADTGMIILPNRRAARALAGAFLQANGGQALLLPRMIAIDGLDETALSLGSGLDLPPAIDPVQRQAVLAQLILRLDGRDGAPRQLPAAWALAADLARLLDDADYAGVDLAAALPGLVAGELAAHWQTTLAFLTIVTRHWPEILAGLGKMNPAARQVAVIAAQTAAWAAAAPAERVWLVSAGGHPAVAGLARIVAGLADGLLLLPGYDAGLSEAAWEAVADGHAQAGIARLLGAVGARRAEIMALDAPPGLVPAGRAALLSRALLPAAALADWQVADWQRENDLAPAGLLRLAAADEQGDATAIAMVLREALAVPGRSAALITPDRALAVRVSAALKRFGINANDSAGEPLGDTPPAILLRLAARAAAADFAPVALLALLKHPLTAVGAPPEVCRDHARRLELQALRGPRPPPGLAGIRFQLDQHGQPAEQDFLTRLERAVASLTGLATQVAPVAALTGLIAAGEALAATAAQSGAAVLWAGDAGAALADVLVAALAALEGLPDIAPDQLADLLDALLQGQVLRRPRTRDGHPRVAIWGVQEAMLQSVDVAVLAGLHEGVWPAAAEPGPWLSRPMRQAAGLAPAEREIGQAAHDFFALACACPTVVLAAPARRERAPAVPARWLTRLEAMLAGAGQQLAVHPAAAWAAQLDAPLRRVARARPRPCPPADLRPKTLSISDIATLMADPYAIYAGKILRLRRLDDLDEESDASLFGEIVHEGLAGFFSVERDFAATGAAAALALGFTLAMRRRRPRPALAHWWAARLTRIAGWIVQAECARRRDGAPLAMVLEQKAVLRLPGGFALSGRADRIERRHDGGIFIMDYKTGSPPTAARVKNGSAPQLPLEAVMAEAGVFGAAVCGEVSEMAFWQLSGRRTPGKDRPINNPAQLRLVIDRAGSSLADLFDKFDDPATPYLARPHPGRQTYRDDYAGISRSGEWAGADGDDDDGVGDGDDDAA